jgi:RimJ/RimL family protein N-acetyltransferase
VRDAATVELGLNQAIAHYQRHGFSLGTVFEKSSTKFIGRAGLIYLAFDETQPDIEVGYALLPAYWGQGFATELTVAIINWGFAHLDVARLVGIINPANLASQYVLEKSELKFVSYSTYNQLKVARFEIERP